MISLVFCESLIGTKNDPLNVGFSLHQKNLKLMCYEHCLTRGFLTV